MLEVSNVIPSILTPGNPTDAVFVLNNSGTVSIAGVVATSGRTYMSYTGGSGGAGGCGYFK